MPPFILWHKAPHAIIGVSSSTQQSLDTGLDPVAGLPQRSFRACAHTWQHGPLDVAHLHASIDLPHKILRAYRVSPCPVRFPHHLPDLFSTEVWERKAADLIQHSKGSPALMDTGQTGPGDGKDS